MNKDKLFFKIVFSIGIMLLLGLLAGGAAKFLAYFNSGGDREDLLKLAEVLPDEINPEINWLPDDANTGRPMEVFSRDIIAGGYVRALYQRDLSLFTGNSDGVKEYYTREARPKIFHQISLVNEKKMSVERVELNHNIKLHFYSADGQIVSFTDYEVHTLKRLNTSKNKRILSTADTSSYKVIMQLDDGYWRIKHLERGIFEELYPDFVQDSLVIFQEHRDSLLAQVPSIKGINYYPKDHPFKDFWINYDTSTVENDFELIKEMNLNTVRIFINYEQFGKGVVVPEMLLRLEHLLNTAETNKLQVLVTMFDFNSNYNLLNFANTDRQLEVIMKKFKNHPAILAYDLKNEPDIDYHYQNPDDVKQWLRFIISKARKYDPSHPITVGWAYPESANYLADSLDFVSFHYYRELENLGKDIDRLKEETNHKTLLLEEFGLSSYQSSIMPLGKTQSQQAEHLKNVQGILKSKGDIPYMYWTLYDFSEVAGDVAGSMPWQKGPQKGFGVLNQKGKPKEVYEVLVKPEQTHQFSKLSKIPKFVFVYLVFSVLVASVLIFRKSIVRTIKRLKK
ncbi:cellulase family glycosylhydrolase [uncultured Arcticibacterium sp.]|uniref:cellulase family glycosylhydrolase n=1 Tax=uncultured Arcticibacterium sp. TaxID=2173042 RepID=UPI0030F5B3CD